jgi:hypothetical protein|tara:strand:- start:520 stop:771 length:252 start_codon:yes stop_codon:yes gene_type:complete
MAKYKYISESFLDNFLEKVFKKAFDQNYSSAIKKIRKKDPELATAMEKSRKIAQDYRKNVFNKMSKKEQEKTIKKNMDFLRNR